MGIIMTEGVVAPQDVYAPLSRIISISRNVSRPSLLHPWEIFVIVHCRGDVAKNSSSREKINLTGFLVFMASRMAIYS